MPKTVRDRRSVQEGGDGRKPRRSLPAWGLMIASLASPIACTPPPPRERGAPAELPTLQVGRAAPGFVVESVNGEVLDSRRLLGARPMVIVVFATWCEVCELTLPVVRGFAEGHPEVLAVGVLVEDAATPAELAAYLGRRRIAWPMVDGRRFPRFAYAFDPRGEIPAVTVVNRQGVVTEHQVGWRRDLGTLLENALEPPPAATPGRPGGP